MRRFLLLVALVGAAAVTTGCDDKKSTAQGTVTHSATHTTTGTTH